MIQSGEPLNEAVKDMGSRLVGLHMKGMVSSESFTIPCAQSRSCVQFFVTPWTVALQAPLSMGFSKQEFWSGLPFPSPGMSQPWEGLSL